MTRVNNEYDKNTENQLYELIKKETGKTPTEQQMNSCRAEVIASQR